LALAGTAIPRSLGTHVTPVQKVLEMLGEMKAKGIAAMEEEAKIFKEYAEWVDDQQRSLGFSIKTHKSSIEELIAFIDKGKNDIATLAAAIAELEGEIATLEAQAKEATAIREKEKDEYLVEQADLAETVDAIKRAIQILESTPTSVPQAEMLLQKMAVTMPGMRRVLAAFLQEKASREPGAPAVAAYKSSSGTIIDMLEGLGEKFKAELDTVETEEANKAHAYDLEMLHIKDTLAHMNADVEEKTATKAKITADVGEAEGKLAEEKAGLAEDEKMLAEVTATFGVKTQAFESNQKVRKDEIEALSKAIEIISNPTVAASYAEHINLAQTGPQATSLLQMHSASKRVQAKQRASVYLQRKAAALSSKVLAELASQIAENPFAKVVEMIKSLLARLKEEAAAEADHKAWCDDQLKKNKLKREKKTSEVEKLQAEIAVLASQIETMGERIKTLADEQAALTKAMAEATEFRTKEKAQNEDTIADAKAGQEAVKAALVILKEFYASQAALLQAGQVPELKAYKGMGEAKNGVVGMLEVILSDFARLEAETTADEKQAAAEYAKFMDEAAADKLAKHNEEVQLKLDKDQAEFEKGEKEEDLAGVQEELDRALEYFEYLKPNCLIVHVSYEERVKRREEEIVALNEAYAILDGHTMG